MSTPEDLQRYLAALGLTRTPDQILGMWDVLEHVEVMAEATTSPDIYLSSLDPGVGKTLTLSLALKRLVEADQHDHVGVVVFLSTLSEVHDLVEGSQLEQSDFSVLTSNHEANALSSTPPHQARILFTTQQMLQRRCTGSFLACDDFFFRGKPRAVRVWDETIDPGEVITVSDHDLGRLLKPVGQHDHGLADRLQRLQRQLSAASYGDHFSIPSLDLSWVWESKAFSEDEIRILDNLHSMSGCQVRVVKGMGHQRLALNIRDSIPDDLKPLLVLDASGRIRDTYSHWEQRGGVKRLLEAPKNYEGLYIRVMDKGGGKHAWRDEGDRLGMEVSSVINSKPEDKWLVIIHRDSQGMTPEKEIMSRVKGDKSRVHIITWGSHKATNDYRNLQNVILAGTLFMPDFYYEGMARASLGLGLDHEVPEEALKEIRLGEYGHDILQALCRGSVRTGAPCEAYIIASKRSGIRDALSNWFPGCTVDTWEPRHKPLRGRVRDAVKYLRLQRWKHRRGPIPFTEVMQVVGERNTSNFRKTIRNHASFKLWLERLGLHEVSTIARTHFNAFAPVWDPDHE